MKRAAVALGLLAALLSPPAARAGGVAEFHAYLLPETSVTEPESLVTVTFAVDSTGVQFNAYEVTIQWDPAVLAFVPPVVEGDLMLAGCPTSRFKHMATTSNTVTYAHSLLCADSTLYGPGDLSHFTFRGVAAGVSPLTIISDPDSTFFDAGRYVWPQHPFFPRQVFFHNATVAVGGDPTATPGVSPGEGSLRLDFRPNPTRGEGVFRVGASGPVQLDVVDAAGRRVLSREWMVPGRDEVAWRLTAPDGRPLAAGVYFAHLRAGPARATTRIVLVR